MSNSIRTQDMIAEYNKLTGKSITRFSSRAQGERQLAKARIVAAERKQFFQEKLMEAQTKNEARSAAVAASWSNEEVRNARSQRNGVLVDGKHSYRSVRAAFKDLGLPLGSHIKFRMLLKSEGTAEFNGHEFALV